MILKTHWLFIVALFLGAATYAQPSAAGSSRLLTIEGRVEVARAGVATWSAGQTNQTLNTGDRVRTGARSRATIRLSDLSVLRVNELTTMEIRPPQAAGASSSLDLKSGATYFFNRERPGAVEFRTPLASGAIRGTEFHLRVAENGLTEVALLDGLVEISNEFGSTNLASGDQAVVEPGQPPRKTAAIEAINIIQWVLYYPGVIDVDELALTDAEKNALANSIAAYRAGDLLEAQASYPENRQPGSDAERIYRAATLLSVGQVDQATAVLGNSTSPLADALRQLIAAVKGQKWERHSAPTLASEWMAESYYQQSQSKLEEALAAARSATQKSPNFGFSWVRRAELEFSFAHTDEALRALDKGLALSPRHAQGLALRGFLLAAQKHFARAEDLFSQAIAADGALGNAWLGRGLVRIRQKRDADGRADLQVAATLEPRRALLRSYLGKAFSQTRDTERAEKELRLAQKLDPNDPTAWLYSALLAEEQNRINEAVRDLEKSQDLNNNRSVFRSRLLLDQDKAVRSANLARIYRDVGMTDWSVREASRAVSYDYANFSAHQFLANSYDALRDPRQINLRYEAPAVTEYFIASLLAPVGATPLSQNVSAQEYARLFERDHIGIASSTEYFSSGDWIQRGTQYGTFGNTDWSLDAYYRTENGQRKNNDVEREEYTARIKQEMTREDTLYAEVQINRYKSGDVAQYYNQGGKVPGVVAPSTTLRVKEVQEPNVFLGYHREWAPGNHTLALVGRFDDRLDLRDPRGTFLDINRVTPSGAVSSIRGRDARTTYGSDLVGYTAELQQILTLKDHTVVFGGRFQTGDVETRDTIVYTGDFPPQSTFPPSRHLSDAELQRESIYIYDMWQVFGPLQLTAGISYDWLEYPQNADVPPVDSRQDHRARFSPKAGFIYTPLTNTIFRGAYTRSLGGVFFDNSLRLEPTQIAGFNQSLRSIIPESVIGNVAGTRFETFGLGLDQKFGSQTYVSVVGEFLESEAERTIGAFTRRFVPTTDGLGEIKSFPTGTRQELNYRERSLTVSLNQLVGDNLAFGARYRLTDADINARFTAIPAGLAGAEQDNEATLHQVQLYALYNCSCGFFSQIDTIWSQQSNRDYTPDIPGDDFWQLNAFVGYRFWRRHAEARIGVLNITDQNYRLNPLTLYSELPRERTFYASFKFYF